jgi:SAM-dependent methyltransferase
MMITMDWWQERYKQHGAFASSNLSMKRGFEEVQADTFSDAIKDVLHLLPWCNNQAADFDRLTSHESILDYGCGAGRLASRLLKISDRYYGYDPADEAIKLCPKIENAEFSTSLPKTKFDCVVAATVLQHFDDEQLTGAIAEIKSHLHPCGRVVVIEGMPRNGETVADYCFVRKPGVFVDLLGLTNLVLVLIDSEYKKSHYVLTGVIP